MYICFVIATNQLFKFFETMSKLEGKYSTRVNGIIKATKPYLPKRSKSLPAINAFMSEFLITIGKTPTPADKKRSVHKNANQCQFFFSAYIEYAKYHEESLWWSTENPNKKQ